MVQTAMAPSVMSLVPMELILKEDRGAEASVNTSKTMQKWLDDQATLVSGAQLQPTYQPLRPTPKSQSKDRNNNRGNSRSSSRDEADYHSGIQRRASMQSASSSIDSAGSLLLGRHVLVSRRDQGNRLYLGVIKTQPTLHFPRTDLKDYSNSSN
nr:hypothetical protein HmN_001012400 [Hymenolepis microstoma]